MFPEVCLSVYLFHSALAHRLMPAKLKLSVRILGFLNLGADNQVYAKRLGWLFLVK